MPDCLQLSEKGHPVRALLSYLAGYNVVGGGIPFTPTEFQLRCINKQYLIEVCTTENQHDLII